MTADNRIERVEIYDDAGAPAGYGERHAVHRNGAWHRVFHCLVTARQNGKPSLTLQRRGLRLDEYAGQIDVSVAGHLRAGESVDMATRREIREELGIDVPFEALERIGEYPLVVRARGLFIREWTDVFTLGEDRPPSRFTLDPVEVASLISIGLSHACDLWSGMRSRVPIEEWNGEDMVRHTVGLGDFVNDVPDYWRWLSEVLSRRFGSAA
jgi:8-oxo-dGTP pyrophosphatase MutT (NUDIX family)